MKKKISYILWVLTILTAINTLWYWTLQPIWYHINDATGGAFGIDQFWAQFIWGVLLAMCAYIIVLLRVRPQRMQVHGWILGPLNVLFGGANGYFLSQMKSEADIVLRRTTEAAPFLITVALILALVLWFPKWKAAQSRAVRIVVALLLLLVSVIYFIPMGPVVLTSDPIIQYVDDDTLAVLWTTNKPSSGWIEYGPDRDHLTTLTTVEHGIATGDTTHHRVLMDIPDQPMVLRVGSRKMTHHFQTSVVFGNTLYSDWIDLDEPPHMREDVAFYVLSDVHNRGDLYTKYLDQDDYDFVVLNGDVISSLDTESIIVDKLLSPLADGLDSSKPFYFVRGNHETRGYAAPQLLDYLALPDGRYYYTFRIGPIFGIVLDAGEDKLDDHPEYSGLVDFAAYKEEQTRWLASLAASDAWQDAPHRVAFSHIGLTFFSQKDDMEDWAAYEAQWIDLLNTMEVDALFSGHTHTSQIIQANDEHHFPIVTSGGYDKARSGHEALRVFTRNNALTVQIITEDGEVLDQVNVR